MEFPTITSDELTGKLASGAAFVLVDALAPMAYAHSHLPEAINIPPSNVDRARIARRIPDPTTEIVVYCANPDCDDSIETAHKLGRPIPESRGKLAYA